MTKLELENKLLELKEIAGIYPRGYHLRSIANFLRHSERIRNQEHLEFVYQNLDAYMTIMFAGGPIPTLDSLQLFNKYLYPVGQYYESNLGFAVLIKPWIICVFVGAAMLIAALLNASAIIYLIIFSIALLYYLYAIYKIQKGQIYGFQY